MTYRVMLTFFRFWHVEVNSPPVIDNHGNLTFYNHIEGSGILRPVASFAKGKWTSYYAI